MAAWLGSILGVVVVGVIIELMTQNRRMGSFIRSIYGFIVLLVIVSPLPNLLKADWWTTHVEEMVDTELLENLTQSSKQAQITQTLRSKGYNQALVTVVDGITYVNLGVAVDTTTLNELQKTLGEEVFII